MKRSLFCLALAAALLAGCAPSAAPDASGMSGQASAEQAAAAAGQTPEAGALHLLSRGDENGCYLVGSHLDSGRRLLCYADYASMTVKPLCTEPGCTHDSEDCTACLPNLASLYGVWIVNDDTIAFTASSPEGPWPAVYLADRSGAHRRVLLPGNSEEYLSIGDTLMMSDGEALYVCVTREPDEGALTGALCRLPLDGGEAELLFDSTGLNVKGILDGGIVCTEYEFTDPDTYTGRRVLRLHAMDGSARDLLDWTEESAVIPLAADGQRLYWLDEKRALCWMEADGAQGSAAVDWPFDTADPNRSLCPESPLMLAGGRLLLRSNYLDTEAEGPLALARYALDPDTGALTEITLCYMPGGVETPIDLLCANDSDVLCAFAVNRQDATQLTADGMPVSVESQTRRIGLLSLDELWAGNPAYRELACDCFV